MPPSEAFELSCFSAGVVVQSGASGVTISGVEFSRQTADGIVVHSGASNVTVNRCDFEGQGGHGLHALAAVAVTVRHSYFRHILGRGVYANGTHQLEVSDNNLSHIGLHPGQGVSGVNGMSGIVLHSNVRGAIITDNVVADVGYIGIRTAAMGVIASHNVVLRSCLMLDDCAALYAGWGPDSRNIRLHHNFLAVAPGNRRHTPHGRHAALSHGIYLDDRSSNINVAFNVIVNMGGAGINVHNAHSNVLRGNVLVGNEGAQVALDEGDDIVGPNSVHNNTLAGNCLVAFQGLGICLQEVSKFPGLATFHFYANATPDAAPNVLYCASPDAAVSQRLKGRFARQLSLRQYQQHSGHWLGATDVCAAQPDWCRQPEEAVVLLANPTRQPLHFPLAAGGRYHSLCQAATVASSVLVPPFAAEVLVVTQPAPTARCPLDCRRRGPCHRPAGVCRCAVGFAGPGCELSLGRSPGLPAGLAAVAVGQPTQREEALHHVAVGLERLGEATIWLSLCLLAVLLCLCLLLWTRWRRRPPSRRPRAGCGAPM